MNTDKQAVEEMAKVILKTDDTCRVNTIATNLYNAGYRKQSEGEWRGVWDYECSVCNGYSEYKTDYCPDCGAKMKGR